MDKQTNNNEEHLITKDKQLELNTHKTDTADEPKFRILRTVCAFACFLACGIASNVAGPTIVHMRHILNVDITRIALTFTSGRFGYFAGSICCGFVFSRFNAELQLFVSTALIGGMTIIMAYPPNVYMYYVMYGIQSFCRSYEITGINSYTIRLWHGHSLKDAIFQSLLGIWSLGLAITPFMVKPFLVELETEVITYSANISSETHNYTNSNQLMTSPEDMLRVRYGFIITGILVTLTSICFLIPFILLGPTCTSPVKATSSSKHMPHNEARNKKSKHVLLTLQTLGSMMFMVYFSVPVEFLTAFVIEGLKWDVQKGALMIGLFCATTVIGRIMGGLFGICVSISTQLLTTISLTTIGFILIHIGTIYSDILIWLAVAFTGFVSASVLGSIYLWTSVVMEMTPLVSASLLCGVGTGGVIGSAVTGYLFDHLSHMWMVYVPLCASVVHVVIQIISMGIVKCSDKEGEKDGNDDVTEKLQIES